MTVPLTGNRQTFAGSGSSGPFPVTAYGIFAATDVQVTLKTDATGAFVSKLLTTDYTVTLTDPANLPSTFTINWVSTNPAVGETVIADLFIPFTQLLDFLRRGKFPSLSNEEGLDRAMTGLAQLAGPLGLLTYNVEQTDFLSLAATSLDEWDAQSRIIANGKDPVNQQDLATKAFVEATVTGSGQLPPSTAVDDILVGTGAAFIIKTAEQFVAIYAGDGLEADGSGNFQLDLQAAGGLEFNSNEVRCTELLRDIAGLTVATGDILYVDASGDIVKLLKGALNNVLTQTATIPAWASPATLGISFPKNHISGFKMRNDTDTAHDIEIGIGQARNDDDDLNVELAAVLTKRIDAAWVEGDNNGGMATGTVANNTWYHMFLISQDSDPTNIDVTFDISTTGANAPTGWTSERRVGSVLTNGSANILNFHDNGNGEILWDSPIEDLDTGSVGTSPTSITMSVPLGFASEARFSAFGDDGLIAFFKFFSPDQSDQTASETAAPGHQIAADPGVATGNSCQLQIWTNTSSIVKVTSSVATTQVRVWTDGYRDLRGKL